MSIEAMRWAWRMTEPRGSEKLCLLALADYANEETGEAWPSLTKLAAKAGMRRERLLVAIAWLEQRGYLTVKRGDRVTSSRYYLPVHLFDLGSEPEQGGPGAGPPEVVRMPDHAGSDAGPEVVRGADCNPHRNPKNPHQRASASTDPAFERFWKAYPKKAGKGQARRAWKGALRKVDAETLIAGAEQYRDDPTRKPDFTAHPTTWLNGERWADEPAEPISAEAYYTGIQRWD